MIHVTKFTKKKNKDKERSWCVGNLVRDRFYSAVNLVRNCFFPGTVGGVEADPHDQVLVHRHRRVGGRGATELLTRGLGQRGGSGQCRTRVGAGAAT
jgi:hypothetical protein